MKRVLLLPFIILAFSNVFGEKNENYGAIASSPLNNILDCCENLNLYGNSNDNTPSKIKHYDGFTYILGTTIIANAIYPTFTKFDSDNNVVWERQFSITAQMFDFVKADNSFLLVGRTEPAFNGNTPLDNQSILMKIDDQGNEIFTNIYDNNAGELFSNIEKHPNPPNTAFPYYIVGMKNIATSSSQNKIFLSNVNNQGSINWTVQSSVSSNDPSVNSLVCTADGNIVLSGDYSSSGNVGFITKINGTNGSIIQVYERNNTIYLDAVELSNGDIVFTGTDYTNNQSSLTLYNGNSFATPTSLSQFALNTVFNLKTIVVDSNDNLYGTGTLADGRPVVYRAEVIAGEIIVMDIKYHDNGETAFSEATLDVDGSQVYYTDGRTGHPLSTGGADILLGSFDLMLSDSCLTDIGYSFNVFSFFISSNPVTFNQSAYSLPTPTDPNQLSSPMFTISGYPCVEGVDTCCVDEADFFDDVAAGFSFILSADSCSVEVTPNALDDCTIVTWNWGDASSSSSASTESVVHNYPSGDNYQICMVVQELDSLGNRCFEAKHCDLITLNCDQSPVIDCCEAVNIYGNFDKNIPERIKHYDGFTYIVGSTVVGDSVYATFAKFDVNNDMVWQRQFDRASKIFDFVKADDGFLLVGRTEPEYPYSSTLFVARSILAKIDDQGNKVFIREYDNAGKQSFLKIIKHPNPLNTAFPYYIASYENVDVTLSLNDVTILHNMDNQGNINWTSKNMAGADADFARGLNYTSDGHIILTGDYRTSTNILDREGIIQKINGADGSLLASLQADNFIFYDVVELNNANIVIIGEHRWNSTVVMLLTDTNLNVLDDIEFGFGTLISSRTIVADDNNTIYGTGLFGSNILGSALPAIYKVQTDNETLNVTDMKFYDLEGITLIEPTISTNSSALYYAEAKDLGSSLSGDGSILFRQFDLDFSNECLTDTTLITNSTSYIYSPSTDVVQSPYALPAPTDVTELINPGHTSATLCEPPEDCPQILQVSDIPIANGLYQASQIVTSSGTVSTGSVVDFKAGLNVILLFGFSTGTDVDFSAEIEDCTPGN